MKKILIINKGKLFLFVMITLFLFSTLLFTSKAENPIKVPIILYHNITKDPALEGKPLLNIIPENFKIHMQTLKDDGWNTISFEDYQNHVEKNLPLPDKPIIITFDDGYTSNYTHAFPILKELQMKATIFMVTGRAGESVTTEVTYPHFTWEQAREMESSGFISIESHSHLHANMFETKDIDRVQVELRRSKYLIEKNLNKECTVFAFPFGLKTDNIRKLALDAGYKIVCLVGDLGANSAGEDLDKLKRITISGDATPEQLIRTITKNLH